MILQEREDGRNGNSCEAILVSNANSKMHTEVEVLFAITSFLVFLACQATSLYHYFSHKVITFIKK